MVQYVPDEEIRGERETASGPPLRGSTGDTAEELQTAEKLKTSEELNASGTTGQRSNFERSVLGEGAASSKYF